MMWMMKGFYVFFGSIYGRFFVGTNPKKMEVVASSQMIIADE